jgi:hypothetical protein
MNRSVLQQISTGGIACGISVLLMAIFLLGSFSLADTIRDNNPTKLGPPPGKCRILAKDGVIKFPFEIFNGDIRFRGEISGRDVYMLLDDGFMWDQLLFWGSPEVDSLGFEYDGEIGVGGGSNEGEQLQSKTASGITVSFPGVEFSEQAAVITPYSSGNSAMWYGSIGQISAAFFKHFVVDINFDDMIITLIEPDKFEYKDNGVKIPWEPLGFGPWSIPATLGLADGRNISMKLLMDLGYNDQLQITTVGVSKIPLPEKVVSESLGLNIQGQETIGYNGRLPNINIGGYEIKNALVSYMDRKPPDSVFPEVMIGLGLLSRFNLVFDFYNQRMFIKPNNTFDDPFRYNTSGFRMRRQGEIRTIVHVDDNTPASEAGLRVNDIVTEINGKATTDYDTAELHSLFQQENASLKLLIKRDDKEMEVSLKLRPII